MGVTRAEPARQPNVVLIMTDQQRADFSRAEGFPLDTTPFLDELGARGVRSSTEDDLPGGRYTPKRAGRNRQAPYR